jgi:large subunit ribosomal protein L21
MAAGAGGTETQKKSKSAAIWQAIFLIMKCGENIHFDRTEFSTGSQEHFSYECVMKNTPDLVARPASESYYRSAQDLAMPFAIVNIAGFQEKVSKGDTLRVPLQSENKEGDTISFGNVLLVSNDGKDTRMGMPYISGASVEAKVLSHGKADKVRVFKMKHRKRYRRTQGHRQSYTEVEVTKLKG